MINGFTGFVIGWFTNWIVVESLFRPKNPFLGIKRLHGLIPARREDLIDKIAQIVQDKLLNLDALKAQIGTNIMEGDDMISNFVNDIAGQIIDEKASKIDIKQICKVQLLALDIDEFEKLIKSVVNKEFKFIIQFGGFLGIIFGLLAGYFQFFILSNFSEIKLFFNNFIN